MEGSRDVEEEPKSPNKSSEEWPFPYLRFDHKRDSVDQVRNTIMVVAALIAAVSFQAVMSPPVAITEGKPYRILVFNCANTLAWAFSLTVIDILMVSLPFQREIRLACFAMGIAFGITVTAQTDISSALSTIQFLVCALTPWLIRFLPIYMKRLCCMLKIRIST